VSTVQPAWTPPVDAAMNLRRASVAALVIGVIAVVLLGLNGHVLMGVFGVLGLAFGAVNNWMLQKSVHDYGMSVINANGEFSKSRFRGGVFLRLSGITVIAIVIALLVHPDGLGVVAGLAAFQILMLIGSAVPVFRSLRPTH
jgi:hypothetical protein